MIKNAGDVAKEVLMEVQSLMSRNIKIGKPIRGRQIIAIMLESFRTFGRLDLLYSMDLYKLSNYGDKKMQDFKQKWNDILANMNPDEKPKDVQLRDMLYRKLRDNSKALELDLQVCANMDMSDPNKSYSFLMKCMDRKIKADARGSELGQQGEGLEGHQVCLADNSEEAEG